MTAARAQTEVDVANLALVNYLGEAPIGTLGDQVNRARAINAVFGTARDTALEMDDWDFATAWITPAASPVAGLGILKTRYPMPDDCIRVRFVTDASLLDPTPPISDDQDELPREDWAVEAATVNPGDTPSANIVMVTNVTTPLVCYTRRIALPQLWSAAFVDKFAEVLAGMAASAVLKDPSRAKEIREDAKDNMMDAARANAREGAPRHVSRNTSWAMSRILGQVRRPPYRDTGY